jgi:hypothetical protein
MLKTRRFTAITLLAIAASSCRTADKSANTSGSQATFGLTAPSPTESTPPTSSPPPSDVVTVGTNIPLTCVKDRTMCEKAIENCIKEQYGECSRCAPSRFLECDGFGVGAYDPSCPQTGECAQKMAECLQTHPYNCRDCSYEKIYACYTFKSPVEPFKSYINEACGKGPNAALTDPTNLTSCYACCAKAQLILPSPVPEPSCKLWCEGMQNQRCKVSTVGTCADCCNSSYPPDVYPAGTPDRNADRRNSCLAVCNMTF